MKRKLPLETWDRKPHFDFFRAFDEPYHGVCVRVDCTQLYQFAKQKGASVFLCYLHCSLAAAQEIQPFKYRIEGDGVVIYDQIDAGSTVARANGTFGYGYFPYLPQLDDFLISANREVERVRASSDLERSEATNLIRYSALPWLDFTSLSHARMFSRPDSCPRISFGKITETAGQKSMPVSIHVHHALVDGRDVGNYIEGFQDLLNHR